MPCPRSGPSDSSGSEHGAHISLSDSAPPPPPPPHHWALDLGIYPSPAFVFMLSSARALWAPSTETLLASVSLRELTGTMWPSSPCWRASSGRLEPGQHTGGVWVSETGATKERTVLKGPTGLLLRLPGACEYQSLLVFGGCAPDANSTECSSEPRTHFRLELHCPASWLFLPGPPTWLDPSLSTRPGLRRLPHGGGRFQTCLPQGARRPSQLWHKQP